MLFHYDRHANAISDWFAKQGLVFSNPWIRFKTASQKLKFRTSCSNWKLKYFFSPLTFQAVIPIIQNQCIVETPTPPPPRCQFLPAWGIGEAAWRGCWRYSRREAVRAARAGSAPAPFCQRRTPPGEKWPDLKAAPPTYLDQATGYKSTRCPVRYVVLVLLVQRWCPFVAERFGHTSL